MSTPRALNPSLTAFVNKQACFLKSSGLLKVTVCSLSAKGEKSYMPISQVVDSGAGGGGIIQSWQYVSDYMRSA